MSKVTSTGQIRKELTKLLYRQLPFGLWGESIAALGVTAGLWGAINNHYLLLWLAITLIASDVGRYLLVRYHQHHIKNKTTYNTRKWILLFSLGVLISGLCWGVTGSLFMLKQDVVRMVFTIFILFGVVSAANPLYSPNPRIYAIFLIPAFGPFIAWLALQGGIFMILAVLAIIYSIIMLATSFYAHHLISNALLLRFEKTNLVEDLSQTMISLEKRTEELERSLSLVQATLESTDDGILVVSAENKIEDYNKKFINMWKIPYVNLKGQDIKVMINYVSDQIIDITRFEEKFITPSTNMEMEIFDELHLKDGKVYERYSHPQRVDESYKGQVWSFRDVTGRKTLESQLYHQANFDVLTGLPNRALVLDRIAQAIANAKRTSFKVALLFIDVDRFKLINDTLGHTLGDKLLKVVSERLVKSVREVDTVSREGGDEFLIILTGLHNETDIIPIAHKCLDAVAEPFIIDKHKFNSSLSIGISVYPRDGEEAETLIRNADIAMYRAKELGRSNFQFFTDEMNQRIQKRLQIENQLREALQNNEFRLVYQPIVNLKTRYIVGVETLLRWDHPELGEIPPAEFIPIAEDSGMIIPIGEWVLRMACKQMKIWHDSYHLPLQISVNLSARQLKQPHFAENVADILKETQLDPYCLALELTEGIVMDNVRENIEILHKIKEKGISIVIDDFGVGYSSLNYLKQLPVDKVKIDRSFIEDIPYHTDDMAITAAMIALAGKLNLKVIAEGLENREQLDFLTIHNCDEIQGYYFSEPLDVETCTALIKKKMPIEMMK